MTKKKQYSLEELCFQVSQSSEFMNNFVIFLKGWKKEFNKSYTTNEYLNYYYITNESKAKLIIKIEYLPTLKILQEKYEFPQSFFEELLKLGLCLKITRENESYMLLTPEGYAFFEILDIDKDPNGSRFRPSIKKAREIQKRLLLAYRFPFIKKISGYTLTLDTITLTKREIATVLFFVINGNIGKENLYDTQKQQILRAIPNYTIHAFKIGKGRKLKKEEREKVVIRLFEKDLFFLSNEKLFSGINNEESKTFIQQKKFQIISELVKKSIKKQFDDFNMFKIYWEGLMDEYQYHRNILEESGVCYYKKSAEITFLENFEKLY